MSYRVLRLRRRRRRRSAPLRDVYTKRVALIPYRGGEPVDFSPLCCILRSE